MKHLKIYCFIILAYVALGNMAQASTILFNNNLLTHVSIIEKKPENKERKRTFAEISKSIEDVVGALATIIAVFCTNDRYYKSADEYYYNEKPNGYKYDQTRPYNP
jgi:predicted ABC-class ATPase